MTIQIGERGVELRLPEDVDAALIAATSFSLAETIRNLASTHVAGDVAAVLALFAAAELPPIGELSIEIAAAGVREVSAQVASALSDSAPVGGFDE